jgi:hypothetical protein
MSHDGHMIISGQLAAAEDMLAPRACTEIVRQPRLGFHHSIVEIVIHRWVTFSRKFSPQQATSRGHVQQCSERS